MIDRGHLEVDEHVEITWINYLGDFEKEVWPTFQRMGYTKDTALIVWLINKVNNNIDNVIEAIYGNTTNT
jgi:hypothetical protein